MPANAFLTNAAIGNREDLVDIIYNTAPTDTPLISNIAKVSATAVTHEWQRDTLAAPANNAVAEGADATYTAVVPTQRLANQCQISRKTFSISDVQEAVRKAGRKSEINYQKLKQGRELRKDMELACVENPVFVTGATRQLRGLRGWLATNNSLGVGGAAPNIATNTAPTDGTLRNFTEPLLRAMHLAQYNQGGDGTMLMCAPLMKQTISSTFTGGPSTANRQSDAAKKRVEGAIDIYVGDFGELKVVPNRAMSRTREAYLIDPELVALAVIDGLDMKTEELARIGSARNYMMETSYTLEVREERGLAAIRDIQ
jgi:hypothetical protein